MRSSRIGQSVLIYISSTIALAICVMVCRPTLSDANDSVLQIVDSLWNFGATDSAFCILDSAQSKIESLYGPDDSLLLPILARKANFREAISDFSRAEDAYWHRLRIMSQFDGAASSRLGDAYYDLGFIRQVRGDFVQAESLYTECLAVRRHVLREDDPAMGYAWYGLGNAHFYQGHLRMADSLAKKALRIWDKTSEGDRVNVFKGLMLLGNTTWSMGRLDDAESTFRRALSIARLELGEDHPHTSRALSSYASILTELGNYPAAETLYTQAIANFPTMVVRSPDVATMLINRGNIFAEMHRYAEAQADYKQARGILQSADVVQGFPLAESYSGEAYVRWLQGDLAGAASTYSHTLDVLGTILDSSDYRLAAAYHNLASVLTELRALDSAEWCQRRALDIATLSLDRSHPQIAKLSSGLGDILLVKGNAIAAESLYTAALQAVSSVAGGNHPLIAEILEHLSEALLARNARLEAFEAAARAVTLRQRQLDMMAPYLSEQDALLYVRWMHRSLANAVLCYNYVANSSDRSREQLVDLILRGKGQVTDVMLARQRSLRETSGQEIRDLQSELKAATYLLSRAYLSTNLSVDTSSTRTPTDSLARRVQALETQLARVAEPDSLPRTDEVTWATVSSQIPEDAALLEYLECHDEGRILARGERCYITVTLKNSANPQLILLDSAATIDSLAAVYQEHFNSIANSGRIPDESLRARYRSLARQLNELVLQPMSQLTSGSTRLLISPDAALSMISFGTLIAEDSAYLIETKSLSYLSAARDLLRLKTHFDRGNGLLAVGAPDFDVDFAEQEVPARGDIDKATSPGNYSPARAGNPCDDPSAGNWPALPATLSEVCGVAGYWSSEFGEPVDTCLHVRASEAEFIRSAPGRRMIHIATHGFYMPDSCFRIDCDERRDVGKFQRGDVNPLLQSGLILAASKNNPTSSPPLPEEDGVLWAFEIAALDLKGVEVAVLSACQTGRGRASAGEGVHGLKRAFEMAGTRSVVSSLWSIPDAATTRLMTSLYASSDQGIADRLRSGQLAVLKSNRTRGIPDHPFSWGAFTVHGDWRSSHE